jgi:hypothetical protein
MEIGTEAAQFPEKEYINVIFLAVESNLRSINIHLSTYFAIQRGE